MRDKKDEFGGLSRREFLYLSGAAMVGMTVGGIPGASQGAEKKPKYGGRFLAGERYGSPGLDPHKNQMFMEHQNYILMYNALGIMGPLPQVRIYPDVAKTWEISSDGREYIFPLQEGVKFHHGKELDSGDVKYSVERVMNPATRSPKAYAYRWIDSVQVIDKFHLKIRLKEPFGPFLTTLTVQNCPIIPSGWEPTATKPAPGTGPFVFKSFVPNETTEFVRFDQYFRVDEKTGDRLPYLASIHIRKIVDPMVRWTAVLAGDVDYSCDPPRRALLEEMKKPKPAVTLVIPQPVGNQWIYLNVKKPPLDNKKVRQAIAYVIDKNEYIKATHWGFAEPLNHQPFINRSRMYIPVEDRALDFNMAKKLLAETGYPNGFKIEFLEPSGLSYDIAGCEYITGQMKKVGIEATMKVIDWAAWNKSMRDGDYTISLRGDSERIDPDDAYYQRFHSSEIGINNWSRYSTKELDDLLEKGRTTWKWEDRVPIYKKVVEIIREEAPHIYLTKNIIPLFHRDYVQNLEGGASTWFGYHGGGLERVWLDK